MRIRRLGLPVSTRRRAWAIAAVGLSLATAAGSEGPITLDGSVGPAGEIPGSPRPGGHEYVIPSSAGTKSAGNLFHSFGRFGIPRGDAARFTQAPGESISNVISRVTGGEVSTIAGLLKSEVAGADFYLLNPAGVVFAPGAQIDVPAALHISTSDGIHFADGKVFAAAGPPEPGITSAPIPAFGFIGPDASDVEILPGAYIGPLPPLFAGPTKSLSLEGRNVRLSGANLIPAVETLVLRGASDGGRVEILGRSMVRPFGNGRVTVSASAVHIDGGSTLAATSTDPSGATGIEIDAGRLDVHGESRVSTSGTSGRGPGIETRAGTVDLTDRDPADSSVRRGPGFIETRSTAPRSSTSGTDVGAGHIRISATEGVFVGGRTQNDQDAGISTLRQRDDQVGAAAGDAGDIFIETPLLAMSDDGLITARSNGSASAGEVRLRVGTLSMREGSRIEVVTGSVDSGSTGTIVIEASEAVELDGASARGKGPTTLSALSRGVGGAISIEAPELRVTDGARIDGSTFPGGPGDGSDIRVRAARVELSGTGEIDATSRGAGRAGDVEVNATERISLVDGKIGASAQGSGPAGVIRLAAPDVSITQLGIVSVDAQKPIREVPGGGDAGKIEIETARLALRSGGRLVSTTRDLGRGGDIEIRASESVQLDSAPGADRLEQTRIAADTDGSGPGGTIRIDTPYLRVGRFAILETSTTGDAGRNEDPGQVVDHYGPAGDIEIRADRIEVQRNGVIASESRGSANSRGPGGDVRIDTGSLHVAPGGEVSVQSTANGDAGFLHVRASRDVVLESETGPGRNLNSLTELAGRGGRIEVETPHLALVNGGGIVASSTGSGDAGSVDVRAGQIEISGGGQIVADTRGTGAGGDVAVAGDTILVRGEREFGPSRIATRSFGPGTGGSLTVDAGTLALEDGAEISASSAGSGDAGAVSIAARDGLRLANARIATSAPAADGGRIEVRSGGRVELRASSIAADVGDGRGGDVLIAPAELLLLDGSSITAQAGAGQGGTIRIVADVVVVSQDSVVSASAGAQGIDGTVRIEAPGYDFTTSLQTLPADFVDTVTLLGERCAARRAARASFVVNVASASDAGPDRLLPVVAAGGEPEAPGAQRVAVALEPTAVAGRWQVRCDG